MLPMSCHFFDVKFRVPTFIRYAVVLYPFTGLQMYFFRDFVLGDVSYTNEGFSAPSGAILVTVKSVFVSDLVTACGHYVFYVAFFVDEDQLASSRICFFSLVDVGRRILSLDVRSGVSRRFGLDDPVHSFRVVLASRSGLYARRERSFACFSQHYLRRVIVIVFWAARTIRYSGHSFDQFYVCVRFDGSTCDYCVAIPSPA